MLLAEYPETGLQIHELAHQGGGLLPACLEVFAEQFPEYAAEPVNLDELRIAAESAPDPAALFQPHLWLITEQGLVLMFPPLSFGGSHADGGIEVTIPWTDLRPYLNPAAPAPIRAAV